MRLHFPAIAGCCLLLRTSTAFAPTHHRSNHHRLARPQTSNTNNVAPLAPTGRASSNPLFRSPLRNKGAPSSKGRIATTVLSGYIPGIELSDLLYDSTSTAFDAWEWTANLGAPAALVAGAVLVTLSETREDMAPRKHDKNWVRVLKQTFRFMLLSSFALEVVSIFVGTVTGSVLLSHAEQAAKKMVGYGSPLALLRHHHEFEYLTIQITFLQGLFNWLAAVAMEVIIPKEREGVSARRMNWCMASCLLSLSLWILAFYNHHLSFYSDYASMLKRYVVLFATRYFFCKPMRPLSFLYGPSFVMSAVLGWRAFNSPPDLDDD